MSVLDGPHVVTVQNRKLVSAAHGTQWLPDGDPTSVNGSFQPMSASESSDFDGSVAFTDMRFLCRSWPGNANSVVSYAGTVYDCVGDPAFYNMSARTSHYEVLLRRSNVAEGS